jgi:hypothetical protein
MCRTSSTPRPRTNRKVLERECDWDFVFKGFKGFKGY